MSANGNDRYDFFVSRRGSVGAVAREVADVLTAEGYEVLIQDYDIPLGTSFVEKMHDGIKQSRDLVILLTRDYELSPYTRKEFTSFEAKRLRNPDEHHIIILRCENLEPEGLLADNVYQDLVDVTDPNERRRRIIAAVERQGQAAKPPPRPCIGVPARLAAVVARDDAIDKLDNIFLRDKPGAATRVGAPASPQEVGRAAVIGMGGVGKTTLAVEYAYRYRVFYAGVCWCHAETRTALLSSLSTLAYSLGAATSEPGALDPDSIERAARAALQRLSQMRGVWLLVYDNVSSPDEIADLLPSAGAKVLITSRFPDWSGWAEEVPLDVLPLSEATTFLQKRADRSDEAGANALSESLGCLPLALEHAAAFCKMTGLSFRDYRTRSSDLIRMKPRGAVYPNSVFATVSLGYDACSSCPDAQRLICLLAFLAHGTIRADIIPEYVMDTTRRALAIEALTAVSLISVQSHVQWPGTVWNEEFSTIDIHPLTQDVVRQRAYESGNFDAIRGDLNDIVDHAFSTGRSWPDVFDYLLWILHYDPNPDIANEISFSVGNLDHTLTGRKLKNGDIAIHHKVVDWPDMVLRDATTIYRLEGDRWSKSTSN